MAEVAESCSGLAAGRGVAVSVAPASVPLDVGVELEVVVRVLQPVVENACRYARSRVDLSAKRDRSGVLVRVTDDGPGVRLDEVEAIFAPGVRGSAAEDVTAEGAHGAGLGLALARRLARASDGDVTAEPGGDGGHFIVRLPAG